MFWSRLDLGEAARSVSWRKRTFWGGLGVLLLAGVVFIGVFPRLLAWRLHQHTQVAPPPMNAQAQSLHSKLLVVDLHATSLLWSRNLLARSGWGHVDLPRLTDGNVALQVLGAVTTLSWPREGGMSDGGIDLMPSLAMAQLWPARTWASRLQRALHQADLFKALVKRSETGLLAIRSKTDLDQLLLARSQAQANGLTPPVGVMLSLDGPGGLGGDLAVLDRLFDAGFRMAAPPASTVGPDGLLSASGRAWLNRMGEKGMVVDVANAAPPVLKEILAHARFPIVASHSGLRGTCDHAGNLSDEQARAIAAGGGVIGIGFWPAAVCESSIDAIVKAIRYAVALVGIEHVALGSNFDGGARTPIDAAGLAHLTRGLTAAGFSDDDIAKLAGGNAWQLLRRILPP